MKKWKYYAKKYKNKGLDLRKNPKHTKKERKKAKNFRKKYGFGYEETYSLDNTMAIWLIPRLAFLRDNCHGYPRELNGIDEWKAILTEIIKGLEIIADDIFIHVGPKEQEQVNRSLNLLRQWFLALWD